MTINFRNTPFLETSKTASALNRLNWRAEVLLNRNREFIENKRILDLASHDGRFSYVCLKLGAAHVTGIEGRQKLVGFAHDNLKNSGFSEENYTLFAGDVFEVLPDFKAGEFDTILCLGFFYHTIRQAELMAILKLLAPATLIIDTVVFSEHSESRFIKYGRKIADLGFRLRGKAVSSNEFLYFYREDHLNEGATILPHEVSAVPTKELVELLFDIYGFEFVELRWHENESGISDWTHLEDYRIGKRVSYRASIPEDS